MKKLGLEHSENTLGIGTPLLWYLVLVFLVGWGSWFATGGRNSGFLGLLGSVCPLVLAVASARLVGGRPSGIGWRPRVRENLKYYLLAWVGPGLVMLLGAALYFLIFSSHFDWQLSSVLTLEDPQVGQLAEAAGGMDILRSQMRTRLVTDLLTTMLVGGPLAMFSAVFAEAGWIGFCWPELSRRLGRGQALLAGGVLFGLWNLPLIIGGYMYGTTYPGWPYLGAVTMCFMSICRCTCLVWLTEKSGSIWPAALCSAGLELVQLTPMPWTHMDAQLNLLLGPVPLGLVSGIPIMVLALLAARDLLRSAPQD